MRTRHLRSRTTVAAAGVVAAALLVPAAAQGEIATPTLRILSNAPGGSAGDGSSGGPHLSADGTRVAFSSTADNLVPADQHPGGDLFLHDLTTGATSLLSVAHDGGPAAGTWFRVVGIDQDGSRVAFATDATDLIAGDPGDGVFLRDTATGVTSRLLGDPDVYTGQLSADGGRWAFVTSVSLVPEDADAGQAVRADAYLLDIASDEVALVSADQTGASARAWSVSMTRDGSRLVYYTHAQMTSADTDTTEDAYLWDAATGTATLVTPVVAGAVVEPVLSLDGSHLAYSVISADSARNVYLENLATGSPTLVSATPAGVRSAGTSWPAAVSDEGRYVTMFSDAADLVTGANPAGSRQVFLRDVDAGSTTLVSSTATGVAGDATADVRHLAAASADGRRVVFPSGASDLVAGDGNGAWDVFLWDATGVPEVTPPPVPPSTPPSTPPTAGTVPQTPVPAAATATPTVIPLANVTRPLARGKLRVGRTVKVTAGTWSIPVTLSYRWLVNGKAVKKARNATFRLTSARRGTTIAVRVVATAPGQQAVRFTVRFRGRVKP